MAEIYALGVHLPLLRLERAVAAAALRWSGLGGLAAGYRAVAGWDEDAVTLAVEAARSALADDAVRIDGVVFASTSAPFHDRLHAGLMVDALHLPAATATADVSGSRRCATSALLQALRSNDTTLIAAGEKRPTKTGSVAQLAWGDGGAAVAVAPHGFARLIGSATLSHDLIDLYSSHEHPTPYLSEERFVREVAVDAVMAPAIRAALENAGVAPAQITYAVVHEPVAATYKALAARLGLTAPNMAEEVTLKVGDLGAAHALFALALTIERAKIGDRILLAGFGSGCDVLVLEMIDDAPPSIGARDVLGRGAALGDYTRFLSLAGCLDLDWGPRSEVEQKTSGPVLERYGRDMLGFVGGRDSTGNVQFPKSRIPVSPDADANTGLTDVPLANETGRVQSLTIDRLNYSPDPPFRFGLVQFANGARVMMEFCDAPTGALQVGSDVRMQFRIKSMDRRRGFRTYFWKACPAVRPQMES